MSLQLETNRLILRPFTLLDVNDFYSIHQNPKVNQYLRYPIQSKIDATNYIQKLINEFNQNQIARYAVILKENEELIGFSGLKFRNTEENGYNDFYDLGYRFAEEYWGKGLATEAGLAWLDYGFNKMNLKTIHACVIKENLASNHVLKKIGFSFINEYTLNNQIHNWYKIDTL